MIKNMKNKASSKSLYQDCGNYESSNKQKSYKKLPDATFIPERSGFYLKF